eukprot:jgi/Picre1/29226/NNA_004618.t1
MNPDPEKNTCEAPEAEYDETNEVILEANYQVPETALVLPKAAAAQVNFAFHIPEGFKIGTLDSLLGLSDDLVKVNTAIEATVNKIRRQLYEVQEELPEDQRRDITIEGTKPEVYLQTFAWDEAKYPSRRPPKDTVAAIMETVQALDEDLKVKSTDYSQSKTALQAVLRRSTGSLAVRDVSQIVPEDILVSTENLKTGWRLFQRHLWTSGCLAFAFVLFRRVADDVKAAARAKGFQVKDVAGTDLTEGAGEEGEEVVGISATRSETAARVETLTKEVEKKRDALNRWCLVSYAEAFTSWIHVTAIRLFVESILRYGLPPQYLPVLIKPNPKYQSDLRKVLSTHFSTVGSEHFTGDGDLFPFVSFNLAIE